MRRVLVRAGLSLALALTAAPAYAASPDAQFGMQAAQGGLAEVQLARLAETKSTNATVLAFARRMVLDHTPNNAQLASILRAEHLSVPTSLDANAQAMLTRLQSLRGRAFNRAYLAGQVSAHAQMQILLQSEINGGKDARLVAYAKATLPAVTMHLNLAKGDLRMLRRRSAAGGASGGMMNRSAMPMGSGAPMPMGSSMPMPMGSSMPNSPAPMGSPLPVLER
ncbi:MAG: DUF4142 domain-containing protein [Candidatus Eremiobacteraeota bacterium]|nr:DUF4142 domain-containing protein [Candidatus Eremiobacteraeota bacterium]